MKEFIIKNKSIIFIVIFSLTSIIVFNLHRNLLKNKPVELDEVKLKDEIKIDKSKILAVMLQNDTGEYTESESSVFPTTGYRFNSKKSGCVDVNGNIIENALTYNNETNKVNLRTNRKVKCYTYFDKLYTVTYELNGGTFDVPFDETSPVKEVAYGETYGELPEPTKTGYTFKGWNGKNLFNEEWNVGGISTVDGSESNDNYSLTHNVRTNYIKLNSNKSYYVTIPSGNNYFPILYDSNKNYSRYFGMIKNSFIITLEDEEYYLRIMQYNNITIPLNVQIEEGTVATEYEPYYIESDTKVVQRQNHTLKAIWEENS